MSGEDEKSYDRKQPKHLDHFPQEKALTPWERAVLEKARRTALHHYNQKRLHEVEARKDDLFWEKFGAYEASEISKRRQNRNKKSPSRLERYEQLDNERYERNVRFGISGEDVLTGADRLKRRAERFGLERDPSGRVVIPSSNVERLTKTSSLADYSNNLERLQRRRARFVMEPREDAEYEPQWMSDVINVNVDPMDEARILPRKRRFSQPAEMVDRELRRGERGYGRSRGKSIGIPRRRISPVRRKNSERGILMEETKHEVVESYTEHWVREDVEWPDQGSGRQELKDGGVVKSPQQQWDRNGEEWPDPADSTQEWEARGESWDTVEVSDDMERGIPPDKMEVTNLRRDGDVVCPGQRWDEVDKEWSCEGEMQRGLRGRERRRRDLTRTANERRKEDNSGGRSLQSWEAGGETW